MNKTAFSLIGLFLISFGLKANDSQWHYWKKQIRLLDLPTVQLDFTNIIKNEYTTEELNQQLQRVENAIKFSDVIKPINHCEFIEFDKILFDLKLHQLRLKLLIKNSHDKEKYNGQIYSLSNGDKWYQLLTQWWLGADINPSELKKIGKNEFDKAHQFLTEIKKKDNDKTTLSKNNTVIEAAYHNTETLVLQNLHKMFPTDYQFKPAKIMKSNLGMSFPVPGYYNFEEETFYYNPLSENYNLAQVDWLYIHEAIPGHHYQNVIVDKYGICRNQIDTNSEMAFTEGWAAYTETLGQKLGLFKNSNSLYFALKWQALRAMRVIIDVGIHAEGWSTKQASDYWLRHFPEGQDVMEREIKRIQQWPMQVNTYVYGKHKIEHLKQQLKKQQSFNEIEFHRNILSLTHLPLNSVNYYSKLFN